MFIWQSTHLAARMAIAARMERSRLICSTCENRSVGHRLGAGHPLCCNADNL
jgi:hypothetical protein